jgi:lipid-binding SYLF domain-containing protein
VIAALAVSLPFGAARADMEPQELVKRAELLVESAKGDTDAGVMRSYIRGAEAVLVIPEFIKAGFVIGGAVGNGVIMGRDPNTNGFTAPAFVKLSEGSVGLQIGAESSEVIMTVLTKKGLEAILNDKYKIGGDASISVLTIGGGRDAGTTANFDVDIVTFAKTEGLYGGLTLEGTIFTLANDDNQTFYGQPLTAQQIVLQGRGGSANAAKLQSLLNTF